MKKMLKIITATSSLVVMSLNGSMVAGCSLYNTFNNYNREFAVSLLRYQNLPENSINFIKFYEKALKNPASTASNQEFDHLYDNNPQSKAFTSYSELNYDLAHTKMGSNNCQVNWPSLFKQVNLTGNKLIQAQEGVLRFNSILAQLYGKTNTLRLVQSNELNSTQGNVIAYTQTTVPVSQMQKMVFGPKFVDTSLINDQYQTGFWATNNIDSVIIHEYGHALSNFLGVLPENRDVYNNNWNWPTNNKLNLKKYKNHQQLSINLNKNLHAPQAIFDRAQLLMNFLIEQGHQYALAHKLESYFDPANYSENTSLFPYILLQSNYGRTFLRTSNAKDEFLAEAFADWLLTPENQRTWNWELFNKFFVEILPTYLIHK